jgi:voltage-gated potassium channel
VGLLITNLSPEEFREMKDPILAKGSPQMARKISRPNIIEQRMSRFLREPPSVKLAVQVIVLATMTVVVGGGIAIRLVDHEDYSSVWDGMWLALQTVATVGYGDVAPTHTSGRMVAAVLILYGVAFLTVIIAVTSTFVERTRGERGIDEGDQKEKVEARIEAQLLEVVERLDRIESALGEIRRRR